MFLREGKIMKKLSKNFVQNTTVETMATVCSVTCSCLGCATGTYCQCTTISDYAGYQYSPAAITVQSNISADRSNYYVQFDGIV